jgi:hypothetical protein
MRSKRERRQEQFDIFGQMVLFGGGGALLAAWFLNSVTPVLLVAFTLFTILSFMNGLG